MRTKKDYTYNEWKESIYDAFLLYEEKHYPSAEMCVNYIMGQEEEYHDGFEFVGTTIFLFLLSVAVREVELDILEDRVRKAVSFHIILYDDGEYKEDLAPEEIEPVEKDIAFLKDKQVLLSWEELEEMDRKGLLNTE